MKIKTPLHADHQLDQLAGQCEIWRQMRPHPRSRIPQELWDQAVAWTSGLSPSRVAKHVRLGVTDLKKHLATHHELTAVASPLPLGFVEVPPATSWPQAAPAMPIALHRADGARLSIRYPQSTPPLAALVRAFLEGRSCSNSARTAASFWLPSPSMSAKGSRAWPPCVGRGSGRTPLRALSPCSETAQGQPSSFYSMTVRAIGCV